MNCIDTEAKAKNAAFVASLCLPVTPPSDQRPGLLLCLTFCFDVLLSFIADLSACVYTGGQATAHKPCLACRHIFTGWQLLLELV